MEISNPFLIYVIDDDADDFSFLSDVISEHWTNIRLAHFQKPDEFVNILDYLEVPALIVLDLNMPRINGLEVIQKLREHPRWKTIPVIFLSTSSDLLHKKQAMSAGAANYLVKPGSLEQWQSVMSELESA